MLIPADVKIFFCWKSPVTNWNSATSHKA